MRHRRYIDSTLMAHVGPLPPPPRPARHPPKAGTRTAHQQHAHGTVHRRDTNGTPMVHRWSTDGISVAPWWYIGGASVVHRQRTGGTSAARRQFNDSMTAHGRPTNGTRMARRWSTNGAPTAHQRPTGGPPTGHRRPPSMSPQTPSVSCGDLGRHTLWEGPCSGVRDPSCVIPCAGALSSLSPRLTMYVGFLLCAFAPTDSRLMCSHSCTVYQVFGRERLQPL